MIEWRPAVGGSTDDQDESESEPGLDHRGGKVVKKESDEQGALGQASPVIVTQAIPRRWSNHHPIMRSPAGKPLSLVGCRGC